MRTTVDVELVAAARSGDRRALEALVAAYLPLVHNVVRRALPGDPEADDVVQETMLRVVRGLPALDDPERFRAWLVTTAIRQVRNHARGRRAALARRLPLHEAVDPPDPGARVAEDAVNRVAAADERRVLLAATRWLEPDEQRVLALWWQEVNGELTRAEVARALALSPAHTAVRVQRMKERLLIARAVLRAWQATPRCPDLADAGRGWTGAPERRWLKRLARHVRDCPMCAAAAPRASAEHLALGIGLLAVPSAWSGLPAQAGAGVLEAVRRLFDVLSAKPALFAVPVVGGTAVALTVWITPLPADEVALPTISAPAVTTTLPAVPPPTAAPEPVALYVSPDGDDAAAGTKAAPFASLGHAVSLVRPGQTIYLRGGTHRPTAPVEITTSGTPDRPVTLASAPGEHAILDASGVPGSRPFITQRAGYWAVRGLEITGAPGMAYSCESCRGNLFQGLSVHGNLGTGLHLHGSGTADNQVVDGDFHDNRDPAGREADGLALGPGSGTGNVVRGCRTFDNVDDGLVVDDFADPVTVDSTWSWGNGINRWSLPAATGSGHGFDLGGAGAHVVTRSAAWKNNGHGFTASGTPKRFTQNSALRNAGDGFALGTSGSEVRRNYSFGNREQVVPARRVPAEANTWDGPDWGTHVLRELDPATAEGPRSPDGSLPVTEYLTNTKDSSVGAPMTPSR